ncbi:acyl-CoA dehydrogenase family protein [Virgibacillus sediminis]|uniref:Acyl-CoA dehydrogenase family protein n=1 Tax=Virgibacillus sediminis TaxID=202260 RepID=A0ABV7A4W2_9BACI
MKRLFLTQEHEMFRESLKKFLDKEAAPFYEKWEEEKQIPRAFWKKMGERGYLCPSTDEGYGGFGADFGYCVILAEELDKIGTGLASGVSLHNDIATPYIESYAKEERKREWLPKAVSGEMISAIAMTEPGAGSDLAGIQTTAVKEGDSYILNGEKTFITNGHSADIVVVVCKTDRNAAPKHRAISLLAVETGMPGFTKGKKLSKMGHHANDTSELIFENVRVPAENLLGEENKGFYYLMEKLQQERLIVAIQSISSIERMLELTVDYVKQRKAFGKSISSYQNTRFKLAELRTEFEMGRSFVDRLIEEHMAGRDITSEVSMAKWWTTELARKTAMECMQLHGGYGYMEEFEIARRYRDSAVATIYGGTNEIMREIIARGMEL